jgi:uncharacterized protein (DUF433 family)
MPTLLGRVTVDPAKCGGRACIRGMRVRVTDVPELLACGGRRAFRAPRSDG